MDKETNENNREKNEKIIIRKINRDNFIKNNYLN